MMSAVQLLTCSTLVLTLPLQALSCEARDKPLLLSTYLDNDQVETARNLSQVDRSCVEGFVPDSHTGFLTVDKELGNHLFFWFFPSSDNERAPLLLWLNGGPAVPSMFGLFWENGPMNILRNGSTFEDCNDKQETREGEYTKRKYTWTGPFSMLYVDNPVGVGFSFSDSGDEGLRSADDEYAKDMASFMHQFLKLFPEYKKREIYIGGQSYAGKYISALGYEIHSQVQSGQSDFDLTGIYLGAPWFDPEKQFEGYYQYIYNMGVISHQSLLDSKVGIKRHYDEYKAGGQSREKQIQNAFHLYSVVDYDTGGFDDNYVTREMPAYLDVTSLMATPLMTKAAHAGDRTYRGPYDNTRMRTKLLRDRFFVSNKPKMAELLNHYKVLIYNGDYDVAVSTPMLEAALLTTPWKLQGRYNSSSRKAWRRGQEVVGHSSLTGKFCRVVIHGAGHQVPREKPEVTLHMMRQFIADGCVKDFQPSSSVIASGEPLTSCFGGRIITSRASLTSSFSGHVIGGVLIILLVSKIYL